MAAMQGEISSSFLEHQAQVGELGVPPRLCCQPMAPVPSARRVLLCLCSPPFLPAMLPWPEETSVAGKGPLAEPRGAACSALHGCSCMAAARMALGWPVAGRQGSLGHGGVGGLSFLPWGTYVGNS